MLKENLFMTFVKEFLDKLNSRPYYRCRDHRNGFYSKREGLGSSQNTARKSSQGTRWRAGGSVDEKLLSG